MKDFSEASEKAGAGAARNRGAAEPPAPPEHTEGGRPFTLPLLLCMALFIAGAIFFPASSPGAIKNTKALCLECHKEAGRLLAGKNVHRPADMGLCTSCHNPHASKRSKLLGLAAEELCYNCHEKKRLITGDVVHMPVEEGKCLDCHDSHSSNNPGLLKKPSGELCYSCHKKDDIAGKKLVHPEVRRGNCSVCHSAHSSTRDALLTKEGRELCVGCHPPSSGRLISSHNNLSLGKADCTGCHSPHSSDNAALVKANLHGPFAEKRCSACHLEGSIEIRKKGTGLCTKCHEETMAAFNRRYSHLSSANLANPCLSCHSPHASDDASLLRGREKRVCYSCHRDTQRLVKQGKFKHKDIEKCASCHTSHASDRRYFMAKGDETCSVEGCHVTQGRFTHPIGDKALDPRSESPMNCVTCHNPMSSPEASILRAGKDRELCIVCHQI